MRVLADLYALYDFELNQKMGNKSIDEFLQICKKHNAKIIQYRDKVNDIDSKIDSIMKLKANFDGKVLVNDDIELALFCDGVHLGQEDLKEVDKDFENAVKKVRNQIGRKTLGLSTHNKEEILLANTLDIDYIGLGAYRDTSTKKDIKEVLGEKIKELALLSTHPVAIIGGVKVSDEIDFAKYKVVGSDLYLCD